MELRGRIKKNRPTAATQHRKGRDHVEHERGDDEHREDETRRKTHCEIQNAIGHRGHLISQELLQVTFPVTRLHPPRGLR